MKNIFLNILSFALTTGAATGFADPAVSSSGTMTIPEGAVISDSEAAYYTDITMAYDGNGALVITGADVMPLVSVESIDIQVMESFPVQVSASVNGYLSVPCVNLLSPAVNFSDNTFRVVMAQSKLGPAETCIAVTEPFAESLSLDVLNLPAGTYTVDVNGVISEFTLESDNSLPL